MQNKRKEKGTRWRWDIYAYLITAVNVQRRWEKWPNGGSGGDSKIQPQNDWFVIIFGVQLITINYLSLIADFSGELAEDSIYPFI